MRDVIPNAPTGVVPWQWDSMTSYKGCLELKYRRKTLQNISCVMCVSSKWHFTWQITISTTSTKAFASNHSFFSLGSNLFGENTGESEKQCVKWKICRKIIFHIQKIFHVFTYFFVCYWKSETRDGVLRSGDWAFWILKIGGYHFCFICLGFSNGNLNP